MTAQTERKYHIFVKICNFECILHFAIKTSICQLRPLLRFLCLINSFYMRCVSCEYNRSNISNRSNRSNISNILTRFNRSNSIDPIYTNTLLFRKKCRRCIPVIASYWPLTVNTHIFSQFLDNTLAVLFWRWSLCTLTTSLAFATISWKIPEPSFSDFVINSYDSA